MEDVRNFQRRSADPKTASLRGIRGRADPGLTPKATGAPSIRRKRLRSLASGTAACCCRFARSCRRAVGKLAVQPRDEVRPWPSPRDQFGVALIGAERPTAGLVLGLAVHAVPGNEVGYAGLLVAFAVPDLVE